MHYANLNEILIRAKQKCIIYKLDYSFSFTPAQAFALRLLTEKYVIDYTSYLGNKLHQLSNQIHQQYC
ncbi:MAG: hypothetical protein NTZ59_11505 [Bacteroidetes bacterium]|nr:hypothetical protein [Bacteroidota bacterium]